MHGQSDNLKAGRNPAAPQWSAGGFTRFWENPDPTLVKFVVTRDVLGFWPRSVEPVEGPQAYAAAIGELIALAPNFRGRAIDHCTDKLGAFVRWEAEADVPIGPRKITGIDRIFLRGGLVSENRIYSDHPMFDILAMRLLSAGLV